MLKHWLIGVSFSNFFLSSPAWSYPCPNPLNRQSPHKYSPISGPLKPLFYIESAYLKGVGEAMLSVGKGKFKGIYVLEGRLTPGAKIEQLGWIHSNYSGGDDPYAFLVHEVQVAEVARQRGVSTALLEQLISLERGGPTGFPVKTLLSSGLSATNAEVVYESLVPLLAKDPKFRKVSSPFENWSQQFTNCCVNIDLSRHRAAVITAIKSSYYYRSARKLGFELDETQPISPLKFTLKCLRENCA